MNLKNIALQLKALDYKFKDVEKASGLLRSSGPVFRTMLCSSLHSGKLLTLTRLNIGGIDWREYLLEGFAVLKGHPHAGPSGQGSVYTSYVLLEEDDILKRRGHVVLLKSPCYEVWFQIVDILTHRIGE